MNYIIVKKPKRRKSEPDFDEVNIVDYVRRRKEELADIEKFLEEQKKLTKKPEDNKPKAHAFTFTEGLLLAFLFQYTIGPMISAALKAQGLQ